MATMNQEIIEAARKGLDGRGYQQTALYPHELVGNIVAHSEQAGSPPSKWYLQFKTQEPGGQTFSGRGNTVYVCVIVQAFSGGLGAVDVSPSSPHLYPTPIW